MLKITRTTPRFGERFDDLAACAGTKRIREDAILVDESSECYRLHVEPVWDELKNAAEASKTSTTKKLSRANCQHRGERVGESECQTCAGKVMLKIFACSIHGKCCIGKAPEGVRSCSLNGGCDDFRASE